MDEAVVKLIAEIGGVLSGCPGDEEWAMGHVLVEMVAGRMDAEQGRDFLGEGWDQGA